MVMNSKSTGPVERKVTFGTVATYLGSIAVLSVLQAFSTDTNMFGALPALVGIPLTAVLPALINLVVAYKAKHTPRNDEDAVQGKGL